MYHMLCDRENKTIKDSLVKDFDGNHHLRIVLANILQQNLIFH